MRLVKADDFVMYCADGGASFPFTGPFPARVVRVHDDETIVDLIVEFSPLAKRLKHGVPFSETPAKHRWSWTEAFPESAGEPAP